MAWQPLFATVSDNQGYVRGTSSLRGRVDRIGMWLNKALYGRGEEVNKVGAVLPNREP